MYTIINLSNRLPAASTGQQIVMMMYTKSNEIQLNIGFIFQFKGLLGKLKSEVIHLMESIPKRMLRLLALAMPQILGMMVMTLVSIYLILLLTRFIDNNEWKRSMYIVDLLEPFSFS